MNAAHSLLAGGVSAHWPARSGAASPAATAVDKQHAAALRGDVKNGLFFRAGALPWP